MAVKVYWKGLTLVLDVTRSYIQRNQIKIQENLTTDQYNCVVAVLNAVLACLASLPKNTPV